MGVVTRFFYKVYQAYLIYLFRKTVIKSEDIIYCIGVLESIHVSSLNNYNPANGMQIKLDVRFLNAEFTLTWLKRCCKEVQSEGYLDQKFMAVLTVVHETNLDDFITFNNGAGMDINSFLTQLTSLLKELRDSLSKIENAEKANYYKRRIGYVVPSLIEISEGLLVATNAL